MDTSWIQQVKETDRQTAFLAEQRLNALLKPLGSLGILEETAIRLAGICHTPKPKLEKACLLIFAADHGITEEGVSSAPKGYTALQTKCILQGVTGAGVLARKHQMDLRVIDVGIDADLEEPGLICEKVRRGSGNLLKEDAMRHEELLLALEAGFHQVQWAKEAGYAVIGVGEMGIGNTTPSCAMLRAFHPEIPLFSLVGKGCGLTEEGYLHKVEVVEEAVRRRPDPENPLEVLQRVGGLEIAAMTGCYLAAAHFGMPVIIDGLISMAAAYVAWKINPRILPYLFASHSSAEPGWQVMAREMGLAAPLHLQMRLGEGSGCPLMLSLMRDACSVLNEMATFDEMGMSGDFLVEIR